MSDFMDTMMQKAASARKTIVLAEGDDTRTLEAAEEILDRGIADLIILGDVEKMQGSQFRLDGAMLVDPKQSELCDDMAKELFEIRKSKGITEKDARTLVEDVLYFGVMLVKTGKADGMVAGACHSTGDVLRPALQILKTAAGVALVSSFFVMVVDDESYGDNGIFIFADCGLNVQPDAEQLAHIAVESAHSWESLIGTTPHVAMLAHSTYGSAKNSDAAKVVEATNIAKKLDPKLSLDGELQADAAICADVAASKCSESSVAGHANVLVFPDLDAGNIAYKLVQRLAHAEAFGPITQGLAFPVNDLSRGCSAKDIVGVATITCVQAQQRQ